MANPYMRDALMDEMEQNATTRPGQVKTPEPMRKTAPDGAFPAADAGSSTFDPGWGIESNPATSPTRSSETPRVDDPTTPVSTSPADKGPEVTGSVTPPPSTSPAATPPAANAGQNRYAGFDTQRAQDPTTSAKDAFYAATQKAPPMPQDKAGSEAWFNQYIKQALIDSGYQVDWVRGDKAYVRTRENPGGEVIDFNQGADSDASSVAWQSSVNDPSISAEGGGSATAGTGNAPLASMLSDPNALERINQVITELMGQGMSWDDIMNGFNNPNATPQA